MRSEHKNESAEIAGRNPQKEVSDEQLQEVLTGLPDLGIDTSLKTLSNVLGAVDPDLRVEALARALTLVPAEKLRKEREAALKRQNFVQDLHKANLKFAKGLEDQLESFKELLQETLVLGTHSKVVERVQSGTGFNAIVKHYDRLTSAMCEQVSRLVALTEAGIRYSELAESISKDLEEAETLQQKETHLGKLDEHVVAFSDLVLELREQLASFPVFCRGLAEEIRENHKVITTIFSAEPEEKDDTGPMTLFDLLHGNHGPSRKDVPLFRDNPYLTAYLDGIAERIPDLSAEEKESKKRLTRNSDIKYFIDTLTTNADPVILTYVEQPKHYDAVARGIESLHVALRTAHNTLMESGVLNVLKDSRTHARAIYSRIVEQVKEELPGKGTSLSFYASYDPKDSIEYLGNLSSLKKENEGEEQKEKTGPKKRVSRFDQAYLDLYSKLEEMVIKISNNQAATKEIETFVRELLDLKSKTGDQQQRGQSAALQQSIEHKNFAFNIIQRGHGELALDRVPAGNLKFSDLMGSSWEKAEDTFETLLDYAHYSGLYTEMTKRGKVNNNTLIAGPPGCGKNMFLKVLQSDVRVISVNMSTDRVLSMWHGKSEGNIRSLFELCHQQRLRHDLPVAIGWDEIDTLFGQKSGGVTTGTSDIKFTMQKILQSVLDGDTFYDGVALLGFTNEPQHIPATVFRRFASVVVIDPLSEKERVSLMMDYLSGLPLAEGFENNATWDEFTRMSDSAHGDVIGKIFDSIFKRYVSNIKLEYPEKALDINRAVLDLKHAGEKIDQAKRKELFLEHVPDLTISIPDFISSYQSVLQSRDVQGAMRNQDKFYNTINEKLDSAFDGE